MTREKLEELWEVAQDLARSTHKNATSFFRAIAGLEPEGGQEPEPRFTVRESIDRIRLLAAIYEPSLATKVKDVAERAVEIDAVQGRFYERVGPEGLDDLPLFEEARKVALDELTTASKALDVAVLALHEEIARRARLLLR